MTSAARNGDKTTLATANTSPSTRSQHHARRNCSTCQSPRAAHRKDRDAQGGATNIALPGALAPLGGALPRRGATGPSSSPPEGLERDRLERRVTSATSVGQLLLARDGRRSSVGERLVEPQKFRSSRRRDGRQRQRLELSLNNRRNSISALEAQPAPFAVRARNAPLATAVSLQTPRRRDPKSPSGGRPQKTAALSPPFSRDAD